jgi:hypothetical protein
VTIAMVNVGQSALVENVSLRLEVGQSGDTRDRHSCEFMRLGVDSRRSRTTRNSDSRLGVTARFSYTNGWFLRGWSG